MNSCCAPGAQHEAFELHELKSRLLRAHAEENIWQVSCFTLRATVREEREVNAPASDGRVGSEA
jgi:hypothetical protein